MTTDSLPHPPSLKPLLIREEYLSDFRTSLGDALVQQIREAGLDEAVLFVICWLFRTAGLAKADPLFEVPQIEQARPIDGRSRIKIRRNLVRIAQALEKAAKALDALLLVELPYSPEVLFRERGSRRPLLGSEIEDIQNGFRVPTPGDAAEHLRSLKDSAAQFSEAEWTTMAPETEIAWKRVSTMDVAEYYPHFVNERAVAQSAVWLMPIQASDHLLSFFGAHKFGDEAVMRALSAELRDFAQQARIAIKRLRALGSPTGLGRKRSAAERSFRAMFADYAVRTTGQEHEPIGAALFSLLFSSTTVEDYARQRRNDRADMRRKST